ncbi:MAG: glycosyltransferase family 4 protein [Betaproteobacteria bacterium]
MVRATPPLSVLLAGPRFAHQTGGLERALADVVRGLRELGFNVDDVTGASRVPEADASTRAAPRTALSGLNRHHWLVARWSRLGAVRRRSLRAVFVRRATIAADARLLGDLERQLGARDYDVVLYCVEEAPAGGLALALARHPCVVPVALDGLAAELSMPWLLERWLRWRGSTAHPCFGARASAEGIGCAILASRAWADATVRAGLAPQAAHAVYFGVPVPATARPDRPFDGKLLYVGRLVKDKGLHVLLSGVARLRQSDARVRLTIVAGDGPPGYRALIERRIAQLGLTGAVDWRTPVTRSALTALYAAHDALLCWSPFLEPAPLVAMEAMAARLPVVVPQPASPSPIYEDDVTCVTYDRRYPEALARAVVNLSGDPARYRKIVEAGAARIRAAFTPAHTARAYAAILASACADRRRPGQ